MRAKSREGANLSLRSASATPRLEGKGNVGEKRDGGGAARVQHAAATTEKSSRQRIIVLEKCRQSRLGSWEGCNTCILILNDAGHTRRRQPS
jgi:hypothetical protein